MKYMVMEIQVFADGRVSSPCYAFAERNKADNKYYALLSGAAVSKLPIHTVVMLTIDGHFIMSGSYTHEEVTE